MKESLDGRCLDYCWVRLFFAIMFLVLAGTACGENSPNESSGLSSAESPEATATQEDFTEATMESGVSVTRSAEIVPEPTGVPANGVERLGTEAEEADKHIVVCLGVAPMSLFPYEDNSVVALALRHAIYENLYTTIGYEYQSQGLEKMPSISDGDAVVQSVTVDEGDLVKDVNGNVVNLVQDVIVLNSANEAVAFNGTPVEMSQMAVDFSFRPMIWSDGEPVTARDSVFSYQLASDPEVSVNKDRIAMTAAYEVIDERTVRWTGVPGHIDQTYFLNVWQPLPEHQLSTLRVEDLRTSEVATKVPLSSGPFVVRDWTAEDELVLVRNQHYYRKEEGYPNIDRIIVRFGNGEDFLAGDPDQSCDVIANGAARTGILPLLEMATDEGDWRMLTSPGSVFEHIAFGINPVDIYASRRPDWFEDNRVRQAIALCTDRQRMVDELTDGRAELLHAYVSEQHSLFPDDLQKWPYDPEQANALLEEAGYIDYNEDGRRQDIDSGIPMTITLGTNSESSLRLNVLDIFQENLTECGIPVETYDLPAGTWFAEGPEGRLFGRRFDLAEFAWVGKILPDCGLYLSDKITGPEDAGFGGWQNTNVTGWSNEEFDNACFAALEAMPGGPEYSENQREALRIFAQELPAIPLFTNVKVAAVRPWVANVKLDPSQESLLWNIYEWDSER